MTSAFPRSLARLPIQVAPRLGESTDSYIRRLARANHLKPSYLHCFLCGPPQWFGKPRLESLALVSGRSPEALERALADASSPRGRSKPNPRYPSRNPFRNRLDLPVLIANDARRGMTIRSLAEQYKIPPRTVRLALDTSRPAEREVTRGRDPLRGRLIGLIDSMSTDNLNVRGIWTKLMDEHDYSVSYASIRYHLKHQQDREARPQDEAAQSKLSRIA